MSANYQFKLACSQREIADYYQLRHRIFVEEQGLFAYNDIDDLDVIAHPIIAVEADEPAAGVVGVVRIYEPEPRLWYGGRLGTRPDRRKGWSIGKGLITKAVTTANAWGCDRFLATVQIQNVRFFQRLHWDSLEEIEISGITHHLMQADLDYYPANDEIRSELACSQASSMELDLLAHTLKQSLGILHKQDIQSVARFLCTENAAQDTLLGDDCAVIPDGDGYLLLATEGMMPDFVESDPWFAGWSAVMVNVSDIYAMGGRPIAIVDTLWSQDAATSQPLLAGMNAAARAYQVPIVGGHTNARSNYNALSVSILGRAHKLISSFHAQPGDRLLLAIDLRGKPHPQYPFWNAATETDPRRLRDDLELLSKLAEHGLCHAGKDISMGGIIGTSLMLLETSGCGAVIDLAAIPKPQAIPYDRWLVSFPSYGFILSVHPDQVATVQQLFGDRQITCADIGGIIDIPQLILKSQQASTVFWDFDRERLTGFGKTD